MCRKAWEFESLEAHHYFLDNTIVIPVNIKLSLKLSSLREPMVNFNWKCPYCNNATTITNPNFSSSLRNVSTNKSKNGCLVLHETSIACPNSECRELTLKVQLYFSEYQQDNFTDFRIATGKLIRTWNLLPQSRSKPQPDYIPEQIR